MTYTIAVCTVKTPDDGQRNCPKHVEFYSKNKFEKLVHLIGFIIRIYHEARSRERHIYIYIYIYIYTTAFHIILFEINCNGVSFYFTAALKEYSWHLVYRLSILPSK